MIKRILVGLGGTDYTISAINHAVALALQHQAELTGVSVLDERRLMQTGPVPVGAGSAAHEWGEDRKSHAKQHIEWAVTEFSEACVAAGVGHQVIREIGEPFDHLISQARYHDLMVFGLRSLFEFDLVDDPRDALVRMVQSGVRPMLAVSRGFHVVRKVLIAYSGSMESAKAMKRFVQLRLWPDVQIRLVSFADDRAQAQQRLADAANYCRSHGYDVEVDAISGSPSEQILPYAAQWGADLTVIGNSAKNLMLRRILGETALHVIRETTRPVFLAQ